MPNALQRYFDSPYQTPESLRGKHFGSNILIIGSGTSTRDIIRHKQKLKDYFDVIIGVNLTYIDFCDVMDYHIIMEGTPKGWPKRYSRIDVNIEKI